MSEISITGSELRTLIEDAVKFRDERANGQFKVIDTKLDGINHRLDKINGSVQKHEQIINDRAIIVADYMDHVNESKDITKRIRALEDSQLSHVAIKKWIIGTIGITGGIIAILYTLIQVFEGKL
jgi:hypothetical protein